MNPVWPSRRLPVVVVALAVTLLGVLAWAALRDVGMRLADALDPVVDVAPALRPRFASAFSAGPNLGDLRDLAVYADVAPIENPLAPGLEMEREPGAGGREAPREAEPAPEPAQDRIVEMRPIPRARDADEEFDRPKRADELRRELRERRESRRSCFPDC